MSGRDLEKLLTEDYTPEENLHDIVEGYSIWMQYNFKMNTKNAPLGTSILLFLIYGIIFLTVGVYHAFVSETGVLLMGSVLLILLLITWRSGIYNQLSRYWKYRDFDPAKD